MPPLRAALAERAASAGGADRRPARRRSAVDLSPRPYPPLAKALPLGEPASLLRRRPDVRAAERRLAAAAAREGVAAADLYPAHHDLGLPRACSPGAATCSARRDSRAWAVTPALSWAAFDLGSARARLRGAEAAHARVAGRLRADGAARARGNRERAGRAIASSSSGSCKLAEQARESARAAGIARVRYREGRRRLPRPARRRAHAAAGRGRGGAGRSRRLHQRRRALQVARRNSAITR